ncbi:MAG: MobP3 family relaxase [Oscillospiraceae bacterium]
MAKVIFKQWIYTGAGKSLSAMAMLNYIATRDGVNLDGVNMANILTKNDVKEFEDKDFALELYDEFKKSQTNPEDYLQYISKRPGVKIDELMDNGLFGKMLDMKKLDNIVDLSQAKNHVKNLADNNVTIFNSVISLKESDAQEKGLDTKKGWVNYVESNILNVTKKVGISPSTMEWCGALHLEPGHPHVHLQYWDTAQTIARNCDVSAEIKNDIRKSLTKNLYGNDLKAILSQKDLIKFDLQNKVLTADNSILKNTKNILCGLSTEEIYKLAQKEVAPKGKLVNSKFSETKTDEIICTIAKIDIMIKEQYPKGQLSYAFVPLEIKKELEQVSELIVKSNSDTAKAYKEYIRVIKSQAEIYGGSYNINKFVKIQTNKFLQKVSNNILSIIKEMRLRENDIIVEPIEDGEPPNFDESFQSLLDSCPEDINESFEGSNLDLDYSVLDESFDESKKSYEVYPNENNQFAQYTLGKHYLNKENGEYNVQKAFYFLEKSAKQGNQFAQYTLGKHYLNKENVDCNMQKGFYYMSLSANQNNSYANLRLGKEFMYGEYIQQDVKKGTQLLMNVKPEQKAMASYYIGIAYLYGKGDIKRNRSYGKTMLIESSNLGNIYAKNALNNDKKYTNFLVRKLLQSLLDLTSNVTHNLKSNNNKDLKNLTKAQKAQYIKKRQEQATLEWGDD